MKNKKINKLINELILFTFFKFEIIKQLEKTEDIWMFAFQNWMINTIMPQVIKKQIDKITKEVEK